MLRKGQWKRGDMKTSAKVLPLAGNERKHCISVSTSECYQGTSSSWFIKDSVKQQGHIIFCFEAAMNVSIMNLPWKIMDIKVVKYHICLTVQRCSVVSPKKSDSFFLGGVFKKKSRQSIIFIKAKLLFSCHCADLFFLFFFLIDLIFVFVVSFLQFIRTSSVRRHVRQRHYPHNNICTRWMPDQPDCTQPIRICFVCCYWKYRSHLGSQQVQCILLFVY